MIADEDVSAGVDVSDAQDGGIIKVIKKEGSGIETPSEGATVFVHYVGTLLEDGQQFDSSRDRGKLFEFILGRGQVIPGWEFGVETMKKGEICSLTIKAEYAYGKAGKPPSIPENATLVFEIELFYWNNELVTFDSLVSKKIKKKGKGMELVKEGATVDVHIIGRDGDRVFDERDLQFSIGEGGDFDVIPAIEAGLKTMKKGEISIISADASYAFGHTGRAEWEIAANAPVNYEVHLKSFEQIKAPYELTSEERMESAKLVKAKGTEYFKENKYSLALSKFTRLVSLVETMTDEKWMNEYAPMILAGHLNMAICYLKLGKYYECIVSCNKALDRDENNVKALYRKARAQLSLHYLDESLAVFQTVLKLDPKNKDARSYYLVAKKSLDEYRKKEVKVYANMFDKFAARDAEKTVHSQGEELTDGKDVFTRAEEEAQNTFASEAGSDNVAPKASEEKDGNTSVEEAKNPDSGEAEKTQSAQQTVAETSTEGDSENPVDRSGTVEKNGEIEALGTDVASEKAS